jgi:copper chaperone
MEMRMLELKVEGLTCGHCVRAVTEAVHAVAPQVAVAVDLEQGLVKITAGNTTIPTDAVIKAIEEEGYKVNWRPVRKRPLFEKSGAKTFAPLEPVALKQHGPKEQSFFASFCSQKEVFWSFALLRRSHHVGPFVIAMNAGACKHRSNGSINQE